MPAQRDHSKLQSRLPVPASERNGGCRDWRLPQSERCAATMTPCSWSRPKAAPPPSQRSAALAACERSWAEPVHEQHERQSSGLPSFTLVLCRAEAENCGAWVRRSWHRTAPTSHLLSVARAERIRASRIARWRSGERLRQLPRLRCWKQSVWFGEGAAGAASLRRRLGGRWSVEALWPSFRAKAVLVDCTCATGPAMLLTDAVAPRAEARERADGLPLCGSLVRLELITQIGSARGGGDEQESQWITQNPDREIRAAAQRTHSKLQKPPSTPASGERHDGCRDQHEVAGANCSRRDAGVQFGAARRRLRRRARARRFLSACEGS